MATVRPYSYAKMLHKNVAYRAIPVYLHIISGDGGYFLLPFMTKGTDARIGT